VAVGVDGQRPAVADHRPTEDLEVAGRVLGVAERRRGDDPGRVVDGPDEREQRPAALQPVVAAAVDLEEHAGPGHPLPAGSMASRPARPRQRLTSPGQDPPDGPW